MDIYLFYSISLVAIISAFFVIFSRSSLYSVLSLIITFFSISGIYIMLNAQFLGAVQIIVYSGAIIVLFLYIMMMLNLKKEQEPFKGKVFLIVSTICGGLFFVAMLGAIKGIEKIELTKNPDNYIGLTKNLGKLLYSEYVLPFELTGILFLSALVGAITLGKKNIK